MKRFVWILLCGAFLAPPGLALKQDEAGRGTQELSDELNLFVERALSEGLLSPAGGGDTPVEPAIAAPPAQQPAARAPVHCAEVYPLDFTDFRQVAAYQDLLRFQPAGSAGSAEPGDLARAYIALDLSAEAMINLRGMPEHEAAALRQLGRLLEARQLADVEYFRQLTACHTEAGLWLALTMLLHGEREGAQLLDRHIVSFRQLPTQLRDRYAMLAIPVLDGMGERVMAQKLFASFNRGEIQESSQLQLAQAVLELGIGSPDAETALRNFLMQARYQEVALFALIRHGRMITDLERNVLVSGLLTKLEQSHQDADIRASLAFVLEELSTGSRHQTILDMAARPNLQSAAAQNEIRQHFINGLRRDLAGDDPLRSLAAIEALVREDGLLDGTEARAELYEAAVLRAVRLGFGTLADTLARKAAPGMPAAEQRALLAYNRGETEALHLKAEEHPGNNSILRMAALSALNAGDKPRLAELSARLTGDAGSVIALIEQDAASGAWIVPEAVYTAAAALTGEEERRRVRRVMQLRQVAQGYRPAPKPDVSIAGMPETLLRSRLALENLSSGEAH